MKIRSGFVSNSSSSSFVLGKVYMTPEQIEAFSKYIWDHEDGRDASQNEAMSWGSSEKDEYILFNSETCLFDDKLYYFGILDNNDEKGIRKFLESIGVKEENYKILC